LRNINNFSGLIVNTPANVILSQGETNSIRIEGEKNTVKEISTKIENGTLIINGHNNHAVTIHVTVQDISLVEVNGDAKVYANGLINSDILLLESKRHR
jgi:formylmethanofuran dehydrogenase subunit C